MGFFSGIGKAIGSLTGATAARETRRAGGAQARAIERGLREQRKQVGPALTDISRASKEAGRYYDPYRVMGERSIKSMRQMLAGAGGPTYTPTAYEAPTAEEVAASPAVQFRMQQAQRALEMGAAAKGGLFGGGHQRQLAQYMQGLASQEYEQEAARRFREAEFAERQAQFGPQFELRERQQRLQGLQALGGMGLQAAGGAAGIRERLGAGKAGIRTGSGAAAAAAMQAAGQARASGALAGAQARQQGLGSLMGLAGTIGGAAIGGPLGAGIGGGLGGMFSGGGTPAGGVALGGGEIPYGAGIGYQPQILNYGGF